MRIEQLLTMKSKEEACFIIYKDCLRCYHFWKNKWGTWHCVSPWHEQHCRKDWEEFINKTMDKYYEEDD